MAEQKRAQLRKKLEEKKKKSSTTQALTSPPVPPEIITRLAEIRKQIEAIIAGVYTSEEVIFTDIMTKFNKLLKELLTIYNQIKPSDIQAALIRPDHTHFREANILITNILDYGFQWVRGSGMQAFTAGNFSQAIEMFKYYPALDQACIEAKYITGVAKANAFDISNRITLCYAVADNSENALYAWNNSKEIYEEIKKYNIVLSEEIIKAHLGSAIALLKMYFGQILAIPMPNKKIAIAKDALDIIKSVKKIGSDKVITAIECTIYYQIQASYLEINNISESLQYYKKFFQLANDVINAEKKDQSEKEFTPIVLDCWQRLAEDIMKLLQLIKITAVITDEGMFVDDIKSILNTIVVSQCASAEVAEQIIQIAIPITSSLLELGQLQRQEAESLYKALVNLYDNSAIKLEIIEFYFHGFFNEFYELPIPKASNGSEFNKNDLFAIQAYGELTKNRCQIIAYPLVGGFIYAISKVNIPDATERALYLKMLAEFLAVKLTKNSVIYDGQNLFIRGFDLLLVDRVKKQMPEFEKQYNEAVKASKAKPISDKPPITLLQADTEKKKKSQIHGKDRKELKFQQLLDNIQNRMTRIAEEKIQREQKKEKARSELQKVEREKSKPTAYKGMSLFADPKSNTPSAATEGKQLTRSRSRSFEDLADEVTISSQQEQAQPKITRSKSRSFDDLIKITDQSSSAMISNVLALNSSQPDRRQGGMQYQKEKGEVNEQKQEKPRVADPLLKAAMNYRQILAGYRDEYKDISVSAKPLSELFKQQGIDAVIYHHDLHLNLTQFVLAIMAHLNKQPLLARDKFWEDLRLQLAHGHWDLASLVNLSNLVNNFFPFEIDELPKNLVQFQLEARKIMATIKPAYNSPEACLVSIRDESSYILGVMKVFNNDNTLMRMSYAHRVSRITSNIKSVDTAVEKSQFYIERIDCVIRSLVELGETYARLLELIPKSAKPGEYLIIKKLENLLIECKNLFRNFAYHEVGTNVDADFEQRLLKGLFLSEYFHTLCRKVLDLAPLVMTTFAALQVEESSTPTKSTGKEDVNPEPAVTSGFGMGI